MSKEVFINVGAAEIRTAIVENGQLQELLLERLIGSDDLPRVRGKGGNSHNLLGSIILGRVLRVLPGMQAAFVDIGFDRAGFLGAREARCLADSSNFDGERAPKISDCVREGDEVIVQIVKDPIGDKGPRLSANVTLPGRLLVLVPNQAGIALSRRIEDEAERTRLTEICQTVLKERASSLTPGGGYIVRSAAIGAGSIDLREDAERLAALWRPVMAKRRNARAPAMLHRDIDPVERAMRDEVDARTIRVLIDDPDALEVARAYCRTAMPEAEYKIQLFTGPGRLFDMPALEEEIERLTETRLPLRSGGWITIETTEALTAIDVNSGRFTEATGLEETSLRVNLEAAMEIGRQVRLRGIGGVIVVDFIHLNDTDNVQGVLDVLAASLEHDGAPTQISKMSEFGLVEITRKRVREPLTRLLTETCHACCGHGRRRTRESVALDIIRGVERTAAAAPGKPIIVKAAPDVVRWLLSHEHEIRPGLARRGAPRVSFTAGDDFDRQGYDIGTA
ncbi:MAG: Rne/Rng family ribonuclease [Alphaproteobacteria bacterium]|jgi:ribonuclease G